MWVINAMSILKALIHLHTVIYMSSMFSLLQIFLSVLEFLRMSDCMSVRPMRQLVSCAPITPRSTHCHLFLFCDYQGDRILCGFKLYCRIICLFIQLDYDGFMFKKTPSQRFRDNMYWPNVLISLLILENRCM